jgi:hypothetical protein
VIGLKQRLLICAFPVDLIAVSIIAKTQRAVAGSIRQAGSSRSSISNASLRSWDA